MTTLIKSLENCERWEEAPEGELPAYYTECLHPEKDERDVPYTLCRLSLPRKARTLCQKLKFSHETLHIMQGSGMLELDGRGTPFQAGDTIVIPPNTARMICNTSEEFLEAISICSPALNPADLEILEKAVIKPA